jgi:PRTRC genetic system protein C
METIELERVFVFQNNGVEVKLADPSERFSPESVLDHYSRLYPILVNARVTGPLIVDDEERYVFESKMGTKG